MPDFIDLVQDRMEKANINVRGLEELVRRQFGDEARVSRSLISLYLRRKAVPTYEAGHQIAVVLDLDNKSVLESLFRYRKTTIIETETARFEQFKEGGGRIDV